MLGRGGHADKRIATTVAFILKCPASTVPQAMRACKFSDKESKHAGMQMAVRRARDKALAGKKSPPPPSVIISASRSGKKSMSPLTGSTAPSSPPSTPGSTRSTRSSPRLAKEKPKEKVIRRNSRAMQKVRVNKLAMSDFAKRALKRATKWYARERNIPGGLSSDTTTMATMMAADDEDNEVDGDGPTGNGAAGDGATGNGATGDGATTMTMAMGDEVDDDGDGATGNEVNNDSDGATGDGQQ